jgi:hypothetical protein
MFQTTAVKPARECCDLMRFRSLQCWREGCQKWHNTKFISLKDCDNILVFIFHPESKIQNPYNILNLEKPYYVISTYYYSAPVEPILNNNTNFNKNVRASI